MKKEVSKELGLPGKPPICKITLSIDGPTYNEQRIGIKCLLTQPDKYIELILELAEEILDIADHPIIQELRKQAKENAPDIKI